MEKDPSVKRVIAEALPAIQPQPTDQTRKFSRSLHNAPTDDLGRFLMSADYIQMTRIDLLAREIPVLASASKQAPVYIPKRRKKTAGTVGLGAIVCRDEKTLILAPAILDEFAAPQRVTPPSYAARLFFHINKKYSDRRDNRQSIENLTFSLQAEDCYEEFTGEKISDLLCDPDKRDAAKNKLKFFRSEIVDALWYLMNMTIVSAETGAVFHPIGGFTPRSLTFSMTVEFSQFLTRRTFEDHELLRAASDPDKLLGTCLLDLFQHRCRIIELEGKKWVHAPVRDVLFTIGAIQQQNFSFEPSDNKEVQKRQRKNVLDIPLIAPLKNLVAAKKFRYAFSLDPDRIRRPKGGTSGLAKEEILDLYLFYFPLDATEADIADKVELNKKRDEYKQKVAAKKQNPRK